MVVGGRELIDTLWNVNFCQIPLPQPRWRINRYIMECKLKNSIGFPVAADELIDTLWNVNIFLDTHAFSAIIELIDTLWNVNLVETMIFLLCQRINRYIMECK